MTEDESESCSCISELRAQLAELRDQVAELRALAERPSRSRGRATATTRDLELITEWFFDNEGFFPWSDFLDFAAPDAGGTRRLRLQGLRRDLHRAGVLWRDSEGRGTRWSYALDRSHGWRDELRERDLA